MTIVVGEQALASDLVDVNEHFIVVRMPTEASEDLRISNDTSRSVTDVAYTKYKEIKLNSRVGSTIRIKFTITAGLGNVTYGKIYRNGGAIGTERSVTSDTTTFSEDFDSSAWVATDLIQIYCYQIGGSGTVTNFRLYYMLTLVYSTTNQDP